MIAPLCPRRILLSSRSTSVWSGVRIAFRLYQGAGFRAPGKTHPEVQSTTRSSVSRKTPKTPSFVMRTTFESVLAEFGIKDTEQSRPPWATSTDPQVREAEACSTAAETRVYVDTQSLCMGRHPVLWHVQKTLEDPQFWALQIIERNDERVALGYYSAHGRRMIEWGLGEDGSCVKVTDRAPSGAITLYYAFRNKVVASLQIFPPEAESVFVKTLSEDGTYSKDAYNAPYDWKLPADPLGIERAGPILEIISNLNPTTSVEREIEEWFQTGES